MTTVALPAMSAAPFFSIAIGIDTASRVHGTLACSRDGLNALGKRSS
jgi:hypothetical protein